MESTEQLFRREAGRMVAVLTRVFGIENLLLVEDAVQEAFCSALQVWRYRGMPDNPSAWLMATARNRALDILRQEHRARTFAPELERMLYGEAMHVPAIEKIFETSASQDGVLPLMFSCCHPRVSEEGQVAVILNLLCGFSVDEVANAFVVSHSATEKRIQRAKKMLAGSRRLFDISSATDFTSRLPTVQRSLYLLFNEGYHGASSESPVRKELCVEAMRLTAVLLSHPTGFTSSTLALASLMCLNAARLPARLDTVGNLKSLDLQDRKLWDRELMAEGFTLLEQSAKGAQLTRYHIEAAISSMHAIAPTVGQTDWETIVALYDSLSAINPSPVVSLNRAIAVGQRDGAKRALAEISKIQNRDRLSAYPFYHAALGELEHSRGRYPVARLHFLKAFALARNPEQRKFTQLRVSACERGTQGDTAR